MTKDSIPSAITVSLEWAKKLKEAGWPLFIGNHFFWEKFKNDAWHVVVGCPTSKQDDDYEYIAAPNAEEILRRLPERIKPMALTEMDERRMKDPPDLKFSINKTKVGWEIRYWSPHLETDEHQESDSLANAAAAMYCYLSTNNLL